VIQRVVTAVLCAALLLVQTAPAWASNTGSASGRVIDASTKAPIAGAKVTIVSPGASLTVTTTASGSYSFLSLAPDTYTLQISRDGYDPTSVPGITIFADQLSHNDVLMTPALKTIAATHSTSASSLVRSGTTSDVYSVNPAQQKAAKALGGSGSLDQAYSAIASVPGVSIPTGQQGWYQSVFIRGGDYDQVGYEFDGIPVLRQSDGAPITTLSVLGQQEVQVYTGGTPATSDSPGIAGYINQVIKTGTYPGYANVSAGVGGPSFYHKLSVEAGGSTPDRLFSYYVGIAGADETYRYGNQFNGVSDPNYWYPLGMETSDTSTGAYILDGSCGGASPCGPSNDWGATFGPGNSWTQAMNEDRESIVNLHFGIPHHHDQLRDDLQLLYSTGSIFTQFYASPYDIGLGNTPGTYDDGVVYTGQVYAPPNAGSFAVAPFPSSNECCGFDSPYPSDMRDGGSNSFSILKAQYQKNINDRSYMRLIGYSEYTNWFLNGPTSTNEPFGATLSDYEVLGHIFGGILSYSNQLSDKNLLTGQVSFQTQKLQTYNATFDTVFGDSSGQFGSNVASLTNGANCFNTAGQYASCYGAGSTIISPGNVPAAFSCAGAMATTPACDTPGEPQAQWLVTENGQNAQIDDVTPYFTAFSATDTWRPNDRWTVNIGARFDHFAYSLDDLENSSLYPARAFWFNAFNNEYCSAPNVPDVLGTFVGPGVACPAGYTELNQPGGEALVNSAGGMVSQNVLSPRIAATYVVDPTTVLRFSAGVYTRPAATSYHEYNTTQQDLPDFLSQFTSLNYTSPDHDVRADTSNNFDFSYEHRFPKSKLSLKVTPFYRTTDNQLEYLAISAIGGVLAGINVGTLRAYGTEVALSYGDFTQNGLAANLSYTYTNARTQYKDIPGTNGENLIDVMNESIEQYNSYTKGCSTQESAAICGGGIYAANGAAMLTNASGQSIANPYWNSAAQPLMNPNAWYTPYDVIPGPFSSANSYTVPNVASLVLNYKHNRWNITPSITYNDGSYYGSPLSMPGYVPQACTGIPANTPAAPGSTCGSGGAIYVPDPYTGKFDSMGSLREPSQLVGNLQLSYDLNSRMTITVIGNNLYNQCFQRGYAWDDPMACWYSSLPSNIMAPNGPGTQPGAFIAQSPPSQLLYPYGIWFNNTQVGITSAKQPVQVTVQLDIKL
jgi:hypothetical protein